MAFGLRTAKMLAGRKETPLKGDRKVRERERESRKGGKGRTEGEGRGMCLGCWGNHASVYG